MAEVEDDAPAMEIDMELSLGIAPDLLKQTTRTGRHGPAVSKENAIVCLIYDPQLHRIYVGMQLGQVLFWDMKPSAGAADNQVYMGHSCHRLIGTHAGSVGCLACLPPGMNLPMPLLLSGSADRCIKIWNPKRGNAISPSVLVQTLYRHGGTITALATCADHIVSGSTDNTVRLWRCSENCQALLYPPFEQVRILVTMPAWIVSIAVADSVAQHTSDGSLVIGDFEANIKQIYFTVETRPGVRRCEHSCYCNTPAGANACALVKAALSVPIKTLYTSCAGTLSTEAAHGSTAGQHFVANQS